MKFLCLPCDEVMNFAERQLPGDGTLAAVFTCPGCEREMAMLTNPMETQLVSGLGIKIGGRAVPEQPMELTRANLADPREDVFAPDGDPTPVTSDPSTAGMDSGTRLARVTWSPEAVQRLEQVPRFVRGMVKRIYTDWAQENAIPEMTPEMMDRARTELGMEGM